MRSAFPGQNFCPNGGSFRILVQRSTPTIGLALCICLLFLVEPAVTFSTTNPITVVSPTPVTATASIIGNGRDTNSARASESLPQKETSAFRNDSTETSLFTPNERSGLLNKHLRRELSSQQSIGITGNDNIGREIMEAALLSVRDPSSGYDPRFGRPALKAYRSFVYSDKHASDPILLDGLAIKTAKQIRNMIKQTQNMANGIDSPPKNQKLQENPPQHFREKIANSIAKGERRARERGHRSLREVCSGCSRPFNLCLCEVLNQWKDSNATTTPISERMVHSKLIVLQHPNEFRKKHTSTVPLLQLLLGEENVRIKVGYEFTMKDVLLSDNHDNEDRPIMLFPGPEAIDLDKYVETQSQIHQTQSSDLFECKTTGEGMDSLPTTSLGENEQQKKNTLVLIDGTWAEAKRIIRRSPEVLEGCQMVQFAFPDDLDDGEINHAPHVDSIDLDDSSRIFSWPSLPESDTDKATKSRSIYHAMRKEPEEHCLSTLEACGEALKILEGDINGPKLQEALTSVLSKHVELHLKNARDASQSRHNRDTTSRDSKLRRSKQIEESIYGGTSDIGVGGSGSSSESSPSSSHDENTSSMASQPTSVANTPTRLLEVDSTTTVTIRRLTHEDTPVIDAWWENGGAPKSVMTITRSIDADYRLGVGASLGIVDETTGELVACILRYESGPLGILHVSEELRGKGYGTALLKEALKAVLDANRSRDVPLECSAFIKDGNAASENVFSKVGFVRENPNAKRGTGKRRANRKWIYTPLEKA